MVVRTGEQVSLSASDHGPSPAITTYKVVHAWLPSWCAGRTGGRAGLSSHQEEEEEVWNESH